MRRGDLSEAEWRLSRDRLPAERGRKSRPGRRQLADREPHSVADAHRRAVAGRALGASSLAQSTASELEHRTKNLLSIVQSIALLTRADGRVTAPAHVNSLIVPLRPGLRRFHALVRPDRHRKSGCLPNCPPRSLLHSHCSCLVGGTSLVWNRPAAHGAFSKIVDKSTYFGRWLESTRQC